MTLEGVEFLRKIGAALPESLKKRVVDLELKPKFEMKLIAGLTAAETEHLVIDVTAIETKVAAPNASPRTAGNLPSNKPSKASNSYACPCTSFGKSPPFQLTYY